MCSKKKVLKKLQLSPRCLNVMLFSLNFVKFMGNFCKVFAAYKQVRDSTAFLYQITGIYHNKFSVSLKSFRYYHF